MRILFLCILFCFSVSGCAAQKACVRKPVPGNAEMLDQSRASAASQMPDSSRVP